MALVDESLWSRLSPLLDQAIELDGERRDELVREVRGRDPALAAALDRHLAEHDKALASGFLTRQAPADPPSLAGQTFGAYELVERLGAGGMGTVWRARRSDGRFEGDVAVKLLHPSLVEERGLERFRSEGSILSRLNHPGIARLYDAGVSEAGQPYLVLELVDGERIDRFADARKLSVRDRIELFLQIADAVAHAHSSLVVHRDLKPSNILVGRDDRVKLLDFGIATLVDQASGVALGHTATANRALTPEYAAPEQLEGGAITTATDVYALGALLYLLLGGRHPNAGAAGTADSPVELVRAIVERDPQRLSGAVAEERTATHATTGETAANRSSTPERLRSLLRGDLDTIVARALRKRPAERYASVSAFADDLRRYLDHRPIAARPDSAAYRASRFVRRHRLPVALAAMAAAALVAGLAGTITQARRAGREAAAAAEERDFALGELARSQAIHELDAFLLSDAAAGGRPFTAGELLARAEIMARKSPAANPETRIALLLSVGRQLVSLDDHDRGRPLIEEAYDLARASRDPATRARTACALGEVASISEEFARAEELVESGLTELPDAPRYDLARVFCLLRASAVARNAENPELGLARVEEASRRLDASGQGSPLLALRVAMDVAEARRTAGDGRGAATDFAAAYERLAALGLSETETAGTLLNNWGLVENGLGRPVEAERLFRRAIAISGGDGNRAVDVSPMLHINLGRTLMELGRFAEAADSCSRGYSEAVRTGDEIAVTFALFASSLAETRAGNLDDAGRRLDELGRKISALPADHHFRGAFASQVGLLAHRRGDLRRARQELDRAVALIDASAQRAYGLYPSLMRRSALALDERNPSAALADARLALELEQALVGDESASFRIGRAHVAIGQALRALERPLEAAPEFAAGVDQLAATLGAEHAETVEAKQLATTAAL